MAADKDRANENAGSYGEELLCANWNPVVELLEASRTRGTESRAARSEWREEDVDAFLGRVYKAGS